MSRNNDSRIVFIPAPVFFSHSYKEYGFFDPDIPLPVELPPGSSTFNAEDLSEEMILAGILRALAYGLSQEHALYYRRLILSVKPNIFEELTYAAMVKAENNDFDMAVEILDALKGLFPDSLQLLSYRQTVLEKQKEFFRKEGNAVSFEDAAFQEAYQCVNNGDIKGGLSRIRAFLEKEPDVWNAWFLLGWALRKSGGYEHAAASFRQALSKGGDNADTRNELAVCLIETGDLKAARKELETALRYDPENIKTISNLGVLALKTGDKTEASGFFRTVLEIDPEDKIAKKYLELI